MTNTLTAQAATRAVPDLNRDLILLGIFTSQSNARALVQTGGRTLMTLALGIEQNNLTLIETGDGWATIQENSGSHRLVIA